MTGDDLTATGFAQILTPCEVRRRELAVLPDAFLVAVERRCGTPHICLCLTLADAVTMLTELQITDLRIFCVRSEEAEYIAFAEAQAAADRGALH